MEVVTAVGLEVEGHGGKVFGRGGRAAQLPANVKVLAKYTAKIAAGKEDCAGTPRSAQAVFFAEVGKITADHGVAAGLADCKLVGKPVHPAVPRADLAGLERFERALDAALQF